jgi:hypothetical protein
MNSGRVDGQGSISSDSRSTNANQSENPILVPTPVTTPALTNTPEVQQHSDDTSTQMRMNPLVEVVDESELTDHTQWPFYKSTSPANVL